MALFHHLHWMCPMSCGFLVFGFFSNGLTICVFMNPWYSYMKLPVYMMIISVLDVCVILVQTLKIFSCLLDSAVDTDGRPDRKMYHTCLYIDTVSNLLNYVVSCAHVLMVHNRFKAQNTKDVTSSRLNAKRVPMAVTTTFAIISIIPTSIYQNQKSEELKNATDLRCSQLYLFPMNRDSLTDVVVLMLPMALDFLTALFLIALFVKIILKRRRKGLTSRISLAFYDEDSRMVGVGRGEKSEAEEWGEGGVKLHISSSGNLQKHQLTFSEMKERDHYMTKCVVILALGCVTITLPRRVDMALNGNLPDERRVFVLLVGDALLMAYLAGTFFIFFGGSVRFRAIVARYFNEKPRKKEVFSDITLAACADVLSDLSGQQQSSKDTVWTGIGSSKNMTYPFLLEKFKEPRHTLRLEHVTTTAASNRANLMARRSVSLLRRSLRFTTTAASPRGLKPTDLSHGYT